MPRVLTRRQVLRRGALAGAALALPARAGLSAVTGEAQAALAPFRVPLRVPPVLRPVRRDATPDYYDVSIREGLVELLPGRRTRIWGYEGQFPGPTIHAVRGRRVVVRQRNHLRVPAVVHLHGAVAPASQDGHPAAQILPGRFRD